MATQSKACRQCAATFTVTEEDMSFYNTLKVPPPTLCPSCRLQRRLSFRHGGKLYNRKCDLSGKETISMYAQDVPFPVYEQSEWWSDKWEGLNFGHEFNFSRPFFEQFQELALLVPHVSLVNTNGENSYYTNHALNQRNAYLVFGATNNEDVYYGHFTNSCKSVVDSASTTASEFCYEAIASLSCNNCLFVTNCKNCYDSIMIEDCQACHDCIGCFGLRNQEYCVLNQKVGKEKYEEMKRSLQPLDHTKLQALRQKFETLKSMLPHVNAHLYNSENCTGDFIFNSKNCQYAFDCKDCEDSKFLSFTPKGIHSYDCTFNAPDGVEFCYETLSTVGAKNSVCTDLFWYGSDVFYSMECHNSSNLFGCIGLKRKEYCILNKQYPKAEYDALVPKIIEHMQKTAEWGEFFPSVISPFAYNESAAYDFFPLSQEAVKKLGSTWREEPRESQYFGPQQELPVHIQDVPDTICQQILTCAQCQRHYKIIPQELRFYRQMGIPLPTHCFYCRYKARFALRNPRMLWTRKCQKCGTEMQTNYAPEKKEIVYCEKCYLESVY